MNNTQCEWKLTPIGASKASRTYKAVHTITKETRVCKIAKKGWVPELEKEKLVLNDIASKFENPPHIVTMYPDIFPTLERSHLILQYGCPLTETVNSYSYQQVVTIGEHIARGLEKIHKTGYLHNDIKPANIIEVAGSYKIIDFGAAEKKEADLQEIIGTLPFTAPERLRAKEQVGPQSDIYSLGMTLIELLTSDTIFNFFLSNLTQEQLTQTVIAKTSFPTVIEQGVDIPLELDLVLEKMIHKKFYEEL